MPIFDDPLPVSGVELPPGPVTSAFRKSLEDRIAGIISDDENGAVLIAANFEGGEPSIVGAVATRIGKSKKWTIAIPIEWSRKDVRGGVFLKGTW